MTEPSPLDVRLGPNAQAARAMAWVGAILICVGLVAAAIAFTDLNDYDVTNAAKLQAVAIVAGMIGGPGVFLLGIAAVVRRMPD